MSEALRAKGMVPQFVFYRSYLIFSIVMGCGIKITAPQGVSNGGAGVSNRSAEGVQMREVR